MAVSLITFVLASASFGGGISGAQAAYMQCLSSELEAAVVRRIDRESFVEGVTHVCESETALYRRMAVAAIVGQGPAGTTPALAEERFIAFDRANRADLVTNFEARMRLRSGPARVAGLPVDHVPADHD
jgi:hypothetical protein